MEIRHILIVANNDTKLLQQMLSLLGLGIVASILFVFFAHRCYLKVAAIDGQKTKRYCE